MEQRKMYIAIDLKSFFASVECRERGLDPLTTNLVVADNSRTEKTICLAVTPSLKQYGIPGRVRLYELVQKVREINAFRRIKSPRRKFNGKSFDDIELKKRKDLELDYIIATPSMGKYMKYSTNIYNIYLKYFSSEDIIVYSIDEVFIDVTNYLKSYNMKASSLATLVIQDVYEQTGITATCGVGTNLYLAKIAMDVVAKKVKPNKNGVRIACLDEKMYKNLLWDHKPITDFWRVGKGIATRLETQRIFTMGDIAKCSIENEKKLFDMFGVNAELLIDHAWGYETCTIKDINSYIPKEKSISSGQVLHCPYNYEKTRLIVSEMTELLVQELVKKRLVTNKIVLTIGYDVENLKNKNISLSYNGEISIDRYGRKIPKHAHGTINISHYTSSTKIILNKVLELYDKIINMDLLVRRVNISACKIVNEANVKTQNQDDFEQLDIFTDYKKLERDRKEAEIKEEKQKNLNKAILRIKNKYGKNSILKGMNFLEGGTTISRNEQIGGHKE